MHVTAFLAYWLGDYAQGPEKVEVLAQPSTLYLDERFDFLLVNSKNVNVIVFWNATDEEC